MSCITSSARSKRRSSHGIFGHRAKNKHRSNKPRIYGDPHNSTAANLFEALEERALLSASTFIVDTLTDTIDPADGLTSLREAVIAANNNTGNDTIEFSVDGDFTLGIAGSNENAALTGDLDITDNLTITGNGIASTTIDANNIDRVLDVLTGVTLNLNHLTITGGNAISGGAANNSGQINVNDSLITGNTATNGGAVFNSFFVSALFVNNSTFNHNTATNGGAIFSNALVNISGNSTFDSNSATNEGGAILNRSALTITGSTAGPVTFSNNTAADGGAIFNNNMVNLTDTQFTNNSAQEGGAIFNDNNLNITSSTFDNNSATLDGGAIFNDNSTTAINATFSANNATDVGGAIYNSDQLSLTNTTVTANSADFAGGVYNSGSANSELANTIVAGNTASSSGQDVAGNFASQGNNLIGDADASTGFTHGINGDQAGSTASPIDPLLDTLADNGGPTPTHALLNGSPAIDAGDNTLIPVGTITDQRGEERIIDGDSDTIDTVDIGAYELAKAEPVEVNLSAATGTTTEGDSDTTTLEFTITRSSNSGAFTVDVQTEDGTATADSDYSAVPLTTINFEDGGELTKLVTVDVHGDQTVELDESFSVKLLNPTGDAFITDDTATATITNDDEATISIEDAAIIEGDKDTTTLDFTVTLSHNVDAPIFAIYATADGTATGGDSLLPDLLLMSSDSDNHQDYLPDNGIISFSGLAGEQQTISIQVNGDNFPELNEQFFVNLSDLSADGRNVSFADASAMGEIIKDDTGAVVIDGTVVVIGSPDRDRVRVRTTRSGQMKIKANFIKSRGGMKFDTTDTTKLLLILEDGNDNVWVSRTVQADTTILGGAGNDWIFSSTQGTNIIVGGDGRDMISGSKKRDIIIGGNGRDLILGKSGDDILIGGTTNYDNDTKALASLMSEWNSDGAYMDRINNIRNGTGALAGTGIKLAANESVFDDSKLDALIGRSGQEWFLVDVDNSDNDQDLISDHKPGEIIDSLL